MQCKHTHKTAYESTFNKQRRVYINKTNKSNLFSMNFAAIYLTSRFDDVIYHRPHIPHTGLGDICMSDG